MSAINKGKGPASQKSQTQQQTQQQSEQTSATEPKQEQKVHNFFQDNQSTAQTQGFGPVEEVGGWTSLLHTPMSMTPNGELLLAYKEAIREILKAESENSVGVKVITASRNQYRLPFDAILITKQSGSDVLLFCLIVAASATTDVLQQNVSGACHQRYLSVAELYDEAAYEEVCRVVRHGAGEGVTVTEVGMQVIPKTVTSTNRPTIYKSLANAVNSLSAFCEQAAGRGVITNQHVAMWGGLQASLKYGKNVKTSLAGQPIRSDLDLTLAVVDNKGKGNNNKYQLGNAGGVANFSSEFVRLNAYVDIVPNAPQPSAGSWISNVPVSQGMAYKPRVVVSLLEPLSVPNSLELTLLGLAGAAMASANQAWTQAFARQYSDVVATELHNIGSVGLETNLTLSDDYVPAVLDTNDPNFDQGRLVALLASICEPDPIMALDVEIGGSQCWILKQLVRIADGNRSDKSAQATEAVITAANNITGGLFSQHWNQNETIVKIDRNIVHLGSYCTKNDDIRDVRDIDHLAVLSNSQPGDIGPISDWCNSFAEEYHYEIARLEARENAIRNIIGQVEFTGIARRITINPRFIYTLVNALGQAGVVFNTGPMQRQPQSGRSYENYDGYSMNLGYNQGNVQQMFNYQTGGQQGWDFNQQQQPQSGRFM